jgi:hypothetical protein
LKGRTNVRNFLKLLMGEKHHLKNAFATVRSACRRRAQTHAKKSALSI